MMNDEDRAVLNGLKDATSRFLDWMKTSEVYLAQISKEDLRVIVEAMAEAMAGKEDSLGQRMVTIMAETREASLPLFHAALGAIVSAEMQLLIAQLSGKDAGAKPQINTDTWK